MFNLPVKAETPIVAVISRLVSHKGLDLVKTVIEEILRQDVQVIILGKGDSMYENFFTDLAKNYVGKLVTVIAFNPGSFPQNLCGCRPFFDALEVGALRSVADDRVPLRHGARRARNGRIVRQYQTCFARRQRVYLC